MNRTYVVTGAASGIGAATTRYLRERGNRVIDCDLHDAEVIADLATADGRATLVDGVMRASGGKVDAVIANAGGGPPQTSLSLNFFGTVATLEGLRPALAASSAPRAVAVSSIASLQAPHQEVVATCLRLDESAAVAVANTLLSAVAPPHGRPSSEADVGLQLYGSAKFALQRWCRMAAAQPRWAGVGIRLNVVALGFYDTPAAAYVLSNPDLSAAMEKMVPMRGAFPGQPTEAAALLAWLVSAENTQMTGQILFADGGFECAARATADM